MLTKIKITGLLAHPRTIGCILFLLIGSYTNVNANNIYFYHIGARDGLSQINILSIYQDEFGIMWFGSTEGLNRYNGKGIEVFRPSRYLTGLLRNTIYNICGNKSGSMYLHNEKDLVRYDTYTQQFENIHQGNVNAIAYAHDALWVIVKSGIMQYDEQKKILKEYITLNKNITGISSIYPAKDGTIWIGTNHGLVSVSEKHPDEQKFVIEKVYVNSIYQDKNENLWIGTQEGVFVIDNKSGNIINYQHLQGTNSLSNNQVRNFVEDDTGNMWIATFYGLNQFNPQTKQWKQYINNDNISHSLSHSSVFSLYKDEQSTIWVGTYFGGINYFNPEADIFQFYESDSTNPNRLSFPYVGTMVEDKHGNLWVCTEGGTLNCLNLNTRQFSRYMYKPDSKSGTGYNQKSIWYRAERDILYIGIHNGGLAIFDIKTKTVRILAKSGKTGSLPNNTINKIQFYNNALYVLTQSGLVKMDIDTERFYPVSEIPEIRNTLSNIYVYTFFIDRKDRLWVTGKNGIRSIHLKTGEIKEYNYNISGEASSDITDIFENYKGDLFFASLGAGIFRYNPNSDDFDNYTEEKNGLPSNYCYHISETPSGKLIVLYNKGFTLFNPDEPDEYSFRTSSGFPIAGFNKGNTVYVTGGKEIFIGGINGLISFRENDLYKINKDYTLFFDKLFINNKQVYPGDKSGILEKTLPLCSKIDLKYNQNNISVEFATSNYLQMMKHSYEYKLKGFDKDWIPTDTKTISYTNLNTGTYTLYVRETLKQGQKDSKIHSLVIRIRPPFYLTTIAFIIYGILLLLITARIFRFYSWRTKLKTTLEFERKDKERIEELNRTKLRFFTNISHEFRTPLTLIIGQVETLLLQSDLNLKIHNKLVKIHKNTNHLLNLISELLEFRKQEQGFYKLNIKHVELIAYLKDICSSFHDYSIQRQIKYKLECTEKEIHVYIDPAHLQKAIFNLLSNAFKYTSPGGKITIKVKMQEPEVFIQITDNGIGIPPESLNKIFDRFYQLEYRSSGLTSGTGIGLALTKEIIIAHKGKISVESTLNEGSIFTISLKMGTSHFSEEELNYKKTTANSGIINIETPELEGEKPVLIEKSISAENKKATILIVDGNEALLEMLTESMSPYYHVHTASNGKEGLELIYKIQPDLVISDIMIPDISGKDLCYKIKNNVATSHIPVVLLMSQVSDDQILEGYMFGSDACISKPYNIKILISQCNNIINNRRLLYKKFVNQEMNTTPFNAFTEQDQILIDKAIKIIKNNFNNPEFDMNKLGIELGVGRSKLYTKIKEITGFTPNDLTLNLKLQEATNLLNYKQQMNISDIAFKLGFSSTKYFTKCFKTFYGITPMDWRKKNKN